MKNQTALLAIALVMGASSAAFAAQPGAKPTAPTAKPAAPGAAPAASAAAPAAPAAPPAPPTDPAAAPPPADSAAAAPSDAAAALPAEPVAPPPAPPAPEPAAAPPAEEADTAKPDNEKAQKKLAFEIGAGVGLNIATGGLSLGPNPFLDLGVRLRLGPGFLGIAARGGYQRYTANGTGTIACGPNVQGACIASNNGSYSWDLVEEAVTIGLPISYRLFPDKRLHPYFGVIPQLFLLRATATTYGLENTQGDIKFGFAGLLGAQFDVGPGGVFLDAGFQYASLEHKLTGMSNVGAVTVALGYRIAL